MEDGKRTIFQGLALILHLAEAALQVRHLKADGVQLFLQPLQIKIMKCRKGKGLEARSRTKLTKGAGLGIHDGVPRRTRLLFGGGASHLDHP